MSARMTANQLHAAIYSEMCYLANMIPFNPAEQGALIQNAYDTAKQLPQLALVVESMIRSADYGGLVNATESWDAYCERFPRKERSFDRTTKGKSDD